jgi:hypothetical protein
MPRPFGAAGVALGLQGAPTNEITLAPGQVYYPLNNQVPSVPGQGTGMGGSVFVRLGRYTNLQIKDPVTGIWRGLGGLASDVERFPLGSGNIRLANTSGCAVGAVVTTAGSAYTAAPVVTASAGNSVWLAVLGPLVSATVTVGYGGANYMYPPICVIDAPPTGGVQATAYATLSGAVVSSITVTDQGAGYSAGTPNIRLVTDPRDTTGGGALATLALTGAATVAAVLCVDHGVPIVSGTVPTLTFGSGAAAATALMNWGITTYAAGTPGAGYQNSAFVEISALGPAVVAPAYTNPAIQQNIVRVRKASIWAPTGASTGPVNTGGQIVDGGAYVGVPLPITTNGGLPTTVAVVTFTMGGFTDTSVVQPW